MIEWFSFVQVGIASCAGVLCIVLGLVGGRPSDLTLGATALVFVLLIAQIVVSLMAPFVGNQPTGDVLEFWTYLICAAIIPFGAGVWALLDRSRWSTIVLGVACLAVAVMVYRMLQIWMVQIAY